MRKGCLKCLSAAHLPLLLLPGSLDLGRRCHPKCSIQFPDLSLGFLLGVRFQQCLPSESRLSERSAPWKCSTSAQDSVAPAQKETQHWATACWARPCSAHLCLTPNPERMVVVVVMAEALWSPGAEGAGAPQSLLCRSRPLPQRLSTQALCRAEQSRRWGQMVSPQEGRELIILFQEKQNAAFNLQEQEEYDRNGPRHWCPLPAPPPENS